MNYMALIIIASAFWVYYDATKHKIGKIPGEKSFTNMSAGGWAAATWLLWIIGFPLYLIKRKELIEKAKEHPVEVPQTQRVIILGFLGLVFIGVLISGINEVTGDVAFVKNGILEFDKSITVGEAFDNYKYFKNVKWEAFTSENGRRVVQVTGELDIDRMPTLSFLKNEGIKKIYAIFQFVINRDGESFKFHTLGFKLVLNDGTVKTASAKDMGMNIFDLYEVLQEIYNNEPLK